MNKVSTKSFTIISYLIAVILAIYFVAVSIALGFDYLFNYFWLILALCFAAGGKLLRAWRKVPRRGGMALSIALGLLITLFLVVEGAIIIYGRSQQIANTQYLIILGAKVNGTTPSKRLQDRIDAALIYLKENPNTRIIASGGQGPDEGISEAKAISNYLVEKGIEQERIILEDKSTSTYENLLFSKTLIDDYSSSSVTLVTSDFHMLRAAHIAKKLGYEDIYRVTAKTNPLLVPNFYVREFLAVIKDFIR